MPSKRRTPSQDAVQALEEAENIADVALAAIWEDCRSFSTSIRETFTDEVLQEHVPWLNNGNGSCFPHAVAHGLGYMPRSMDTLSEEADASMRRVIAAAALCFIYQGRFRNREAYDRAEPSAKQLRGPAFQLAAKRARLLDVHVPDNRPGTRGAEESWHERLITALDANFTKGRVQLPSTALLLVAELEAVNVVLFVRDEEGRLAQAQYNDQPLAFAPRDGQARRTLFLLHCAYGREAAAANRNQDVLNHYVYLHHGASGDPVLRPHSPGTVGWVQEMSCGMDRVVAMSAHGVSHPPVQQQQQQQQQQQYEQQQSNLSESQEQGQQPGLSAQTQREQPELQRVLQPEKQQSRQSDGSSKRAQPKQTVSRFEVRCCMCAEVLSLPPSRPGVVFSKHAKEKHAKESIQALITQVQSLCSEESASVAVPPSVVKWASKARCCQACNGLMSEPTSLCVNCRRAGVTQRKGAQSNNSSQNSSQDNSGSQDSTDSQHNSSSDNNIHGSQSSSNSNSNSTNSSTSSSSDTDTESNSSSSGDSSSSDCSSQCADRAASSGDSDCDLESNHSDSGDARGTTSDSQQRGPKLPSAQHPHRQNPYAKRAAAGGAGVPASAGAQQKTPVEATAHPEWTQNDTSIAAALDSIAEAEMVLINNVTSARTSRSPRQRRQYATVITWVQLLLKRALDARRESAIATAAGAGCTQARQAELSVTRAAKLLYFLPALAFGRQMQGKGTKPKERMDALYSGNFGAALQKYIDAHRHVPDPLHQHQYQRRDDQPECSAPQQKQANQCPVSDADAGWSESDRRLHESCAELAGQRGGVAQAARKLEAREQHAPADEATQQVLRDKHPEAGSREGVTDSAPDAVRAAVKEALQRQTDNGDAEAAILVTAEDVIAALSRASAGKAAGPDGMRYEHAWAALKSNIASATPTFDSATEDSTEPTTVTFAAVTAEVFTMLLNEPSLLPEESWRLLRAANLCGLGDKRRPVACASVWRRLMASIAAKKVGHKVGPLLQQLSQLGCGVSSGVEHVATTTRMWQQTFGTVIQLDCANAFNSVDRLAIINGLERFCPELLPYFESVYCGATMPEMRAELRKCDGAQKDAVYITLSELGCQQGDPLGPLLFAVAMAHALNPLDECDTANAGGTAPDTGQSAADSKIGPHVAYLDDMNLLVTRIIDELVVNRLLTTQSRLNAIGLKTNLKKSLAVAQQGHTFSAAERDVLDSVGIPFVDASTAVHEQGFITVGVPVGTKRYVDEQLRSKLMEKSLWRFAWQLVGLAETNLQAAMIIFRGSFTRRFGYVARNVNPQDSAVWLSGYDGVCAWVFERMLFAHGVTSASDIQQHILASCMAGDCDAASRPEPLVMLTAGPVGLESLPLHVARLQEGAGGLGLPSLGKTCAAPYVAQLQVTLQSGLEQVLPDTEQAPVGFASYDAIRTYHAAVHSLISSTDIVQRQTKRGPSSELLQWASVALDGDSDSDDRAFAAVFAGPICADDIDATDEENNEIDEPSTAQHNTNKAVQRSQSDVLRSDSDSAPQNKSKGLQRRLMCLFQNQAMQEVMQMLDQAGDNGRQFLAQLRSQRAPFAMAWLGQAGLGQLSTVETATMLLNSVGVEPWNLRSDDGTDIKCCFCGRVSPTMNHIMGCEKQHLRGHNAVHTGQKCCVQNILRSVCGFRCHEVWNENTTMFTVPVRKQVVLQADTALAPRSLSLCGDQLLAQQGVVLDSSVTAATTAGNMRGVRSNAANTDGHASVCRERSKHRKHSNRYNTSRWKFVPFVQEAHGRLGKEAAQIIKHIAEHAAQRSGGTESAINEKRLRILLTFKSRLSMSLARQMAQRVFAHVRGSAVHGQYAHPFSALLSLTNASE